MDKNIEKSSTKKQTLILWFSALMITYLLGYFNSVLDPNFPISGTIGINGEKVTYKFDKITDNSKDFDVFIRTDIPNLNGFVEFKNLTENSAWKKVELIALTSGYSAKLKALPPNQSYEYRVFLIDGESKIQIPVNTTLRIMFMGEVSIANLILYKLLLFIGLTFSVRVGLEYFSGRNNHKKLLLSNSIFYFLFSFIAAPVVRLFEAGVFGDPKISLAEIFLFKDIFFFLITVFGFILIFNTKRSKLIGLVYAICVSSFYLIFYH